MAKFVKNTKTRQISHKSAIIQTDIASQSEHQEATFKVFLVCSVYYYVHFFIVRVDILLNTLWRDVSCNIVRRLGLAII